MVRYRNYSIKLEESYYIIIDKKDFDMNLTSTDYISKDIEWHILCSSYAV